ncbi:Hypothetical protein R9X50_00009600 [Acrodontium crateriforme]|uniref:Uncharacterized protein n=1 Tax=Acrodontium crateriforme TaxID=150365 RepID=A0AAQ3LZQ5_9PEZI|nr:Hypothetical protein R9X50_00009600 [Acrodontium crateriforme]
MVLTKKREKSPSSTPVPSTEPGATSDGAQLPEAEWDAMHKVLNHIYDYRGDDGWDPSKLFHRKVNKRVIPEYYDTIKEPMALSIIKQKVNTHNYQNFQEFVRDFALIPHNAQVFNRPDSGAFQDALVIKEQIQQQLQLLVKDGVVTQEAVAWPDLGEIPTYEDLPTEDADGAEGEEGEDEEDSDEDAEEEDEDEAEDDEEKPKRRRGRPVGSTKRAKEEKEEEEGANKKSRGRPPKLLTPMEARILAIMKGIRKPKNQSGQLMIRSFERLPDKAAMPEYYHEVKNPMAFDVLKKKVKRKKYRSVEEFMTDVNLMFNNAKGYNTDDSQIYKEAVQLQIEAGKLYDAELAKPDDSFADDEGKIPMPNGILHNGELYKVGDWVHLQNPNDLTKPMPCQIYRTYKAPDGENMVNVCWYYRPEQTVHRFDKHFLHNEVVKTGRYRDHKVEEIEGKCFVMFFTRYYKGRPRGLPQGMEIYVCEARYNETLHQFNKIKTWASCLPDEVRDKDYEMDLFDHPRKMKKFPSPIAYLLKDSQKETDELPKVQWGAEGAPPKIGAVHRRPRSDRESLPPEPTPPPPPKMPTPPPKPAPTPTPSYQHTPAASAHQPVRPLSTTGRTSFKASISQSYAQPTPLSAPRQPPSLPMGIFIPSAAQVPPPRPTPSLNQQHVPPPTQPSYTSRPATAVNYRDPPPIEVYVLPEQANFSIPADIREQYQQDVYGRVLFFTTPPAPSSDDFTTKVHGHSVRYLAEKERRAEELSSKRKAREEAKTDDERKSKVARTEASQRVSDEVEALLRKALNLLENQIAGSVAVELGDSELANLSAAQKSAWEQRRFMEANAINRIQTRSVKLDDGVSADDWDNRLS